MCASSATVGTRRCASPGNSSSKESEAILRKEGDRLIVEPVRKGRLLALLGTLEPLSEPFPDVDEDLTPPDDVVL